MIETVYVVISRGEAGDEMVEATYRRSETAETERARLEAAWKKMARPESTRFIVVPFARQQSE